MNRGKGHRDSGLTVSDADELLALFRGSVRLRGVKLGFRGGMGNIVGGGMESERYPGGVALLSRVTGLMSEGVHYSLRD